MRMVAVALTGACYPTLRPAVVYPKPYSDAFYDKFWAAAQEYNLPLAMHIFTGATSNHDLPNWGVHNYTLAHVGIARVILDLVWGGTVEKFPGLRFMPTEFDAGWIPYFNQRNDWNFAREGGLRQNKHLSMLPSEYWKRNFRVTIEDDEMSIRCRDLIGVENIMWGNDYPHHDGLFPESQQTIDKMFQGVPAEDRYKITVSNACKPYGLPFEY